MKEMMKKSSSMPRLFDKHLSLQFVFRLILGVVIVGILVLYGMFQARLLISGPTFTLTHEVSTVEQDRVVIITGIAENIISLTLNDRPIFTDDNGNFSEILVLPDGYTIMTLRARDRYGRETVLRRSLVHKPLI